jgi:signal transduction histidine kinase
VAKTEQNLALRDRLFAGGGEMGSLMRATDWSATPLGPPEHWPQSLRSIVRVLLTSKYAMWMGWGPELTFLYNDAYAAMTLGAKHPWGLGKPSRVVWPEIWSEIGPRIEKVIATGEATYEQALMLFLERNGYPEETYHTFSYSPISDDDGTVRGHLCVVTEDTERILGERRLAVLKELGAQLSSTNLVAGVFRASEMCLSSDSRDLPFTLIYEFEVGAARLVSSTEVPANSPRAPKVTDIRQLESIWSVDLSLPSIQVADAALPESWGAWGRQIQRVFVAPIIEQAQAAPTGVIIAGINPFRMPDESYLTFVNLYVRQIAAGLANARAYEEAKHRAEALAEIDRAKTLFFTNVSHEFRTPLTLILGPLEELLASAPQFTRQDRERLDIAHRNGLRLLKLVNTLLDFSRIEAGRERATFQPTDLAVLTRNLAASFQSLVEGGGLTFEVDCRELARPAYVDREMWEQIVLNLISNAFKFTFEGNIRVSLEQRDDRIELAVSDTGIGIPDDQLLKIFDRFHRVEGTRSRTFEGSGIGLALVRELVKMHAGEVNVASVLGKGSTFTVSIPSGREHLPTEQVDTASLESSVSQGAALYVDEARQWVDGVGIGADDNAGEFAAADRGARILLADDNVDMREYIQRMLAGHYEVEAVSDGREAVESARARRPDLLLTDVMMPNLDGFGLIAELRADPELKTVPIIVLSARAGEEARVEGLERGADDYLIKPFSSRELLARIHSQLELHRMRAQVAEERKLLLERERQARVAAEEANRSKDEFLALLGHELRNPLAPIFTALQLINLRKGESTERERAIIERQINHLARLVDDLLDISRIKRGNVQLKKESIEIATVVAKAIEMASPLIEGRMHYLFVAVPNRGLLVNGDPARLTQAISNLLTNAAKYTEPTGRIWISAGRKGKEIELSVRDNGIGMTPELVSHVFDLFYQGAQGLDRSGGGLGLGLSIVRNLVTLHGGSVEASSAGLGKGSEFTIRLPAAEIQAGISEPLEKRDGKPPSSLVAGSKVLIVDDNEDAAEVMSIALQEKGHVTRSALEPLSAIEIAREFQPDVILLDIGLPVMDGYELSEKLRQFPELSSTRFIALTGYGQASDRERSKSLGFEHHLSKPIDLATLDAIIRKEPQASKQPAPVA